MPYLKGTGHTVVVALGGNALGNTPIEQLELVRETSRHIVDMVADGTNVVVTHGNGPQVGMITDAFSGRHDQDVRVPEIPLPEAGSMSQGYIGYQLSQAILNELRERRIMRSTACVVTQTVVDADDPAFANPTKPVGPFLSEEEAARKATETGYTYGDDAGRGWRHMVASPRPQRIVEFDAIKDLVDGGYIVIAAGGGGVPVLERTKDETGTNLGACGDRSAATTPVCPNGRPSVGVEGNAPYVGVPAVIDKDRSSARLAADLGADMLIILTAVENVAINYNTAQQQDLTRMTATQARKYIRDGQFAAGSMLPKVEACVEFVESHPAGSAVITSLERAAEGIRGQGGTVISVR